MRYCPICWSERRIRHLVSGVRDWWDYSVLKKPKPDMTQVLKKIIPTLVGSIVALKTVEEIMKALEEEHGRANGFVETHKELR